MPSLECDAIALWVFAATCLLLRELLWSGVRLYINLHKYRSTYIFARPADARMADLAASACRNSVAAFSPSKKTISCVKHNSGSARIARGSNGGKQYRDA